MLMPHTISLVSRTPLSWSSSQVLDLPFLDSRLESTPSGGKGWGKARRLEFANLGQSSWSYDISRSPIRIAVIHALRRHPVG